jgi:hypothetical protein
MRKIFAIIFTLTIIISFPLKAFATNTSWVSTENVTLSKTQNQFNIEIAINNPNAYAGAEFGVQCSDGVTVKSIKYSKDTSKVGPAVARGLTWFSYYSGNNDFSGKVIATIELEYTGNENTSIVIDNIGIYTKNGAAIDTEMLKPRKAITINREGATNPIVIPPEVPSSSNPPTTNNGSSNGSTTPAVNQNTNNSQGSNNQTNTNTANNSSTTNTINSTNTTSSIGNQVDSNNHLSSNNTQSNNSTNESPIAENTANNQMTSNNPVANNGQSSSPASVNTTDSPINNDNVLNNGSKFTNAVTLVLLIISLIANAILGYFIIKIKNKK